MRHTSSVGRVGTGVKVPYIVAFRTFPHPHAYSRVTRAVPRYQLGFLSILLGFWELTSIPSIPYPAYWQLGNDSPIRLRLGAPEKQLS